MEQTNLLEKIIKERDTAIKKYREAAQTYQSDATAELFTDLVKAQSEFSAIAKSSKGYNYKYAPLEAILNSIRPILNQNNLLFYQFTDEMMVLHTRICHTSGQWIESRAKLREAIEEEIITKEGKKFKKTTEQVYGSIMTSMRRYQALAILGIQPENEDDDAPKQYYQRQ